ncbi:hypothetical protein BDD12DRAFT_895622 [Trichophaea hybrida]|nr:hypothetical protein BDD12DRAFT_895622 [Trichophaea hybrida]
MLSYGSETTASTNDSWRTPSTDRHGQTYTLVAPSEFNFPTTNYIVPVSDQTPRSVNAPTTLKCLFWFTGCSEIFNDTPGEWYPHIMDHLAPYERETLEHGPLECSLCGAAFDTWYLVFSHAFNHIRRGDRQPGMSDANMVEYLAEQSIITPEQKRVALEPRRRAAPRMGYYDTRRSRNLYPNQMGYPDNVSMAYTLRGMDRDLS